jgi:RNA 3'-terminal phosphate cyclase (ATP)
VFQALAEGCSKVYGGKSGKRNELVEPSLHAKTAQWVAHEVLGVEFDDEGGCEGAGFGPRADADETDDLARNMEKLAVDDTSL